MFTTFIRRDQLANPKLTSIPSTGTWTRFGPWLPWMEMGDRPGHMIGAWSGRKLAGPQQLPAEFQARVRAEHPELLRARWSEFDRPLPARLALG